MKRLPIIILAAALCIAGCGQSKQKDAGAPATKAEETIDLSEYAPKIEKGSEAYDISAKTPEGEDFLLSSLRGKYVVVDFWASWCPDCRAEIPAVKELYSEFHPKGVEFVSLSFDKEEEAWKNCISESGMEWLQVSNLTPNRKEDPNYTSFDLHWIPTLILVDPDGKYLGYAFTAAEMKALLEAI